MTSLAASSFVIHMKILRWCGYSELRTGHFFIRFLHKFYRFMFLTIFTVYIIQEVMYMALEANDLDAFARVMLLLLLHFSSFTKMAAFRLQEDKILNIIEDFNGETIDVKISLDSSLNPEDKLLRDILSKSVIVTKRVVKTFVSSSIFTCIIWSVFPIIDFMNGKKIEYYIWLSDIDYNKSPIFELTTLYSGFLITLIAIANTALDALIAAILAQCKAQLTILRYNLEHLTETCKESTRDNRNEYEDIILRELRKCMNHYSKIIEITKKYESVFGVALFLQFGFSGWIICMTMYKAVNVNPVSIEFMSLILFMLCMLVEIFLFCYYGNEVKFESDRISESVYAMSWTDAPRAFHRSLFIIMERAKRPIAPTAGFIIPLSLETFMKVLKSSYSFYAVLREVKE